MDAREQQAALMGSEEFRRTLGIGRSGFYAAARQDRLPVPTIRVGGRFMFSRRAIEAMLDRQHINAAPRESSESGARQ